MTMMWVCLQVRQLQQEQIAKDKRMEKLKNAESSFDNRVEQVSFFLTLSLSNSIIIIKSIIILIFSYNVISNKVKQN